MALSDKDILITPNSGSSTDDPKIEFTGATSSSSSTITVSAIDLDGGTLSFEGSAGQLFSVTNNLTSGSIFSVNDVSGVPSIDVNSDGTILLAPFETSPLIGIGKTNPDYALDIKGTTIGGPFVGNSTLATFDPPGGGTGTDTATDVAFAFERGDKIAGYVDGHIRSMLQWSTGSEIIIGQSGTSLITGINLISGTSGNNVKVNGNRILTTSDEGSGNGLDADLLDGLNSLQFLRSDTNEYKTGGFLRFNDALNLQMGSDNDISFFYNGNDFYMDFNTAGDSWYIRDSGDNAVFGFSESGNLSLYKGDLNVGDGGDNSRILIKKADNNVSDHIQFYNGTTRMGEIGVQDTTWLRINQVTGKNIYTPRYIRADAGFFVDGTSKGINGSGNFFGGTIAGASDYGTLLRSDANDTFTGTITGNTLLLGGSQITSSSAVLQVNGFQRTGNIVLHEGGNTPTAGADGTISNTSGNLQWKGSTVWTAANDGAGSGLDADTVDGISSASFLRSDANDVYTGTLTGAGNISFSGTKIEIGDGSGSVAMTINDGYGNANLCFNHAAGRPDVNGNALRIETNVDSTTNANFVFEGKSNVTANTATALTQLFTMSETGATCLGNTVWHAGNDGSGSGLDADTVDGIQGASFLRSDANDTASGTITFNGTVNFRNAVDLADNDILRFGSGDDCEFFCNGVHMYMDLNSGIGNFYIRDGTTTRFTFDDNGSFTATSNITAFSDINLKKNIEVIPNALDKVSQICGVTFDRIDLEDEPRQSGVIAQEVEKVLPEVVRTTEDGTKTVAYGNMVGLLIEAIKEQQKQIDDLKAKLGEGN